MRIPIGAVLLLNLWLLGAVAVAHPAHPMDPPVEIDGLVLDQTRTKAGHDFYYRFSSLWEGPTEVEPYNIVILENASPQWGSLILIKVNDLVVFKGLLKPRDVDIRELAAKAVEQVKSYVRIYLKDGQKLSEDDLAASGW